MESDTVRLRSAAPRWSLEGDSQLLSVLQSLHQTIITKCQETNTQLDEMVNALDNASIDLQNVNNKFMALSNSQFVESRVYEDEEELTDNNTHIKQESSKPETQSSISSLKLGLQVLESLHEVVAIVASDSDDEEQSPRRVLRPRGRGRLPHVVGSQAWRDATHAGLSSDADSDDSTDKRASALEEYSDSDTDQQTASSSSLSSMTSHVPPPPVMSHTPSGHDAQTEGRIPEPELEESPKPRKLYTVEKHIPAQIFPDEPPPLDRFEEDSDDDIFAELHKQSYPHSNKGHNVADDLFGSGSYEKGNIDDNDIGNVVTKTVVRENSPLFSRPIEPESKVTPTRETYTESVVKKPVGGISLFGSKGSESIGAAILKRNQRQSSSESDTQTKKPNIIEDLFTKPIKNIKKEPVTNKNQPVAKEVVNDKTLFSDNIFDDIDDIFTSNVITKTKDNKDKDKETLFDDDLFKNDSNDLFNDKIKDIEKIQNKSLHKSSSKDTNEKIKSIFDSDSEDDLFSDVKLKDNSLKTKITDDIDDKSRFFDNVKDTHTQYKTGRGKCPEIKQSKTETKFDNFKHTLSPNIFDDDNEDDLFNDKVKPNDNSLSTTQITVNLGEEIQCSNNTHDIKSEIIKNNKVNSTEAETKALHAESEQFEEKHISDIKNIDVPYSDATSEILINESEMDKEDIKRLSVDTKNNEVEVTTVISDPKILSLPEIDFLDEINTSKEEDISRVVTEQNYSKDVFVDIFDDLPPAFEKPMESKKSKNVNALFDDDSDDEALFFKKDDVITDEKPDFEFKSDRFQIFHDEPPDYIDVDFSQKSRHTNQIPDYSDLSDQENIVSVKNKLQSNTQEQSLTKSENPIERENLSKNVSSENKHNVDIVNSTSTSKNQQTGKTDILKLLESERDEDIFKTNKDIEEDILSDPHYLNEETNRSDIKVYTNKEDTDSSENEKKLVGRLKPVTININVSTLLPGAVPKKSKSNEETDGQTSSKNNEENNPDYTEPQMVKTVSFKGSPDSEVLDNKLSKERAKIQVKRRPSTRRARLEAVRKSGLDFGSDSTDNSSSFDEPVKAKHKNDKTSVPYKKLKDDIKLNSELKENNDKVKEVTSKVVYILNDEDIFTVPDQASAVAGSTDIADDLFNPISTKTNIKESSTHHTMKDKTQSFVDTDTEKQGKKMDKPKKWLFDDMSDDDTELFKKPVQKTVFDSDSESELFSGKKFKGKSENRSKEEQKKFKEIKAEPKVKQSKVEKKVTKALFSDDSDEDLFGGKANKTETSKPTLSATKTSQTFEDPLSVLDDDA